MIDIINKLNAKIASFESQVDLLEAELIHLNEMLLHCGFPEGVKTLKAAVEEYLSDEEQFSIYRKQE